MAWYLELALSLFPHHSTYLVIAIFWATVALVFQSFVLWSTKEIREIEYRLGWEVVCLILGMLLWGNSATALAILTYQYIPGGFGITIAIGFALSTTVLYFEQVTIPALGKQLGNLWSNRLPQTQA